MRPAAGFLSVRVTPDAPRIKSKSQDLESIVSHSLKFAEGQYPERKSKGHKSCVSQIKRITSRRDDTT